MSLKPSICLVAHFAYGAITGGREGHVGGVERQTSLMAKWFAAHGYNVCLITWEENGKSDEYIDGVRVIKTCAINAGIPGVRFFVPRWSSLIRALKKANADIYYQNCGEYVTGQIALWCKLASKKFVYSLASDMDADPNLPVMKKLRERILYKYGLKNADCVIAQTNTQKNMLLQGFNLSSTVLPMPCEGPSDETTSEIRSASAIKVLWVGRIQPLKRLEMFLDLADQFPGIEFHVAGKTDGDKEYTLPLLEKMASQENVFYHGMVARELMPDLYQKSSILCCTSEYEGFPNTFLEAWSFGVPVISTFDPDKIIEREALGISVSDQESLFNAIKTLTLYPDKLAKLSSNSMKHYIDHHSVDNVMKMFERVFCEVVNERK